MYRVIALTALAAVAAAQSPELQSNDGSINIETREGVTVTRRQQISVFDLSNAVTVLQAENSNRLQENSNLRVQMAALGGANSPLALGVQAIANDMQARTSDLLTAASDNTNRLNSLEVAVSSAQVAVATVPSTLAATVADITTTTDSRINAVLTSMDSTAAALTTSIGSVSDSVAVSISRTRTAVDAQITTALTRVASSITAVNRNVTLSLAGKADANIHMWTGGCANRGHSGWQEYCLNQAHVNTAAPKFRKHTNTRFQALVAGYYSINYWVIYRACGWQYQLIYVANSHRVHGYQRQGYHESGNSWRDSHQYLLWPITAGQQFWGRSYSGCWYTWHQTSAGGSHSRITAVYSGTIAA